MTHSPLGWVGRHPKQPLQAPGSSPNLSPVSPGDLEAAPSSLQVSASPLSEMEIKSLFLPSPQGGIVRNNQAMPIKCFQYFGERRWLNTK